MSENALKQVDRKTRDTNLSASRCNEYFRDYTSNTAANGNAVPVTTDTATNVVNTLKTAIYATNIGTQTLLAPVSAATGLEIGGDQTSGDGFELNLQYPGNTDAKFLFTIGETPFFVEGQFTVADMSGVGELKVGFRKNATVQAALASYTDFSVIGNAGLDVKTFTNLNAAGMVTVDSTENVADGATVTYRVEVDMDGKATFFVATSSSDTIGAPTVSQEFTFDTADVVVPLVRFIHDSDVAGSCIMNHLKSGYLN